MSDKKAKPNIWLDSILATIFVLLFMLMIANISQFKIFDAFDSVGNALEDMEITDVAFSQLRDPLPPDTNIVLVNIGNLPRGGIGEQLKVIDKYGPKVIGLDSFFMGLHDDDPEGDSILANALNNAQSEIVMVAKVMQSDSLMAKSEGDEIYDSLYKSNEKFIGNVHLAIANLDTDAKFQEDIKICRSFPPKRTLLNGESYVAFAVRMAQLYDSTKANEFLDRDNLWEIVNYRGNFVDFFSQNKFSSRFYVLDWDQVLNEDFVPELIEGKIVLFGFLGDYIGDTDWEDKFFTPLNLKVAGRANPDMYGPVIHANIVSMVLNGDYVNKFGDNMENILGILLLFVNVVLFSIIYHRAGAWYDGITKLIQVLELMLLTFLVVWIFSKQSFKLELTIAFFGIALVGDLLEVYYGVIKNVFSKKTLNKLLTLGKRKE